MPYPHYFIFNYLIDVLQFPAEKVFETYKIVPYMLSIDDMKTWEEEGLDAEGWRADFYTFLGKVSREKQRLLDSGMTLAAVRQKVKKDFDPEFRETILKPRLKEFEQRKKDGEIFYIGSDKQVHYENGKRIEEPITVFPPRGELKPEPKPAAEPEPAAEPAPEPKKKFVFKRKPAPAPEPAPEPAPAPRKFVFNKKPKAEPVAVAPISSPRIQEAISDMAVGTTHLPTREANLAPLLFGDQEALAARAAASARARRIASGGRPGLNLVPLLPTIRDPRIHGVAPRPPTAPPPAHFAALYGPPRTLIM